MRKRDGPQSPCVRCGHLKFYRFKYCWRCKCELDQTQHNSVARSPSRERRSPSPFDPTRGSASLIFDSQSTNPSRVLAPSMYPPHVSLLSQHLTAHLLALSSPPLNLILILPLQRPVLHFQLVLFSLLLTLILQKSSQRHQQQLQSIRCLLKRKQRHHMVHQQTLVFLWRSLLLLVDHYFSRILHSRSCHLIRWKRIQSFSNLQHLHSSTLRF